MSLLTCKEIAVGYGSHVVAQDINISLDAGDYLCVVGKNGSGKSTLVKTIAHLLPPLRGSIEYGDGLCTDEVGYLSQTMNDKSEFPASVIEVVRSGFLNQSGIRPFYTAREKQASLEAMQKLGIEQLAKRCFRELSGGQRQRVLLARAMCASRRVLLLDEPVAGLDLLATQEMYALLESLNRKENMAIFMVSHDLRMALRYATHILHIDKGQLYFGTKELYLLSPVGKLFIGEEAEDDCDV